MSEEIKTVKIATEPTRYNSTQEIAEKIRASKGPIRESLKPVNEILKSNHVEKTHVSNE